MSFDAYQSSLLRFAIAQYQRGVDRHRNAFGRTHSTVKASAELGIALVGLPLYIAARASVLAGRRFKGFVIGNRLSSLSPQSRRLLNFSGFDALSENLEFDDVAKGPDQPIFQTLVAVGACLSSSQIRELYQAEHKSKQLAESKPSSDSHMLKMSPIKMAFSSFQPGRLLRRWRTSTWQLLNFERTALTDGLSLASSSLSVPKRITGVASDLKARSLLLILDYSTVSDSLRSDQQQMLQRRITEFIGSRSITTEVEIKTRRSSLLTNWITQSSVFSKLLRRGKRTPSEKGVERIDASKILQISSRPNDPRNSQENPLPQLFSHRLNRAITEALAIHNQPDVNHLSIQTDTDTRLAKNSQLRNGEPVLSKLTGKMTVLSNTSELLSNSDELDRDAIEADVLSVTYVEHPLERLLKWVDRVLLWLEVYWQRFKHFAARRTKAIFHQ